MRQYVAPLTRSAAKGQKPCRTRSARFAPAAARSGCHRGELVDAEGDFACGENDGPTVCGRLRTVSRATSLVLEDALGRAMVAERRRFPGSAGTGGRPRCTRPAAPEPPGPGLHMPPDPRPVLRPRPCRTPRRGGGRETRPGGVLPAADPVKAGRAGRGRRELEEGRRGPERAGGPEGPGPGRGERAGRAEGTGRAGRAAGDGDGGPGGTLRRRASPTGSRGSHDRHVPRGSGPARAPLPSAHPSHGPRGIPRAPNGPDGQGELRHDAGPRGGPPEPVRGNTALTRMSCPRGPTRRPRPSRPSHPSRPRRRTWRAGRRRSG